MSTWLKALLGIGVGVATVVIVKKVVVDKKYATVKEADTESKSLLKRLKEAAKDKVADIVIWFANHPNVTQIISVVLSVVPVIIGIGSDLDLMLTNRRIDKRLSMLEDDYYLKGFNAGKTDLWQRALDGCKSCANDGSTLTFALDNGERLATFKVSEVVG